MDKHDFSEFYEIGGLLIELHVKENLKDIDHRVDEDYVNKIKSCATYLLSLTDDEFHKIYINLPRDIEGYDPAEEDDEIDGRPYTYYTYAYAYVSSIELIRKCLAISKIPLFNSIQILIEYTREDFIDIDVASCKLLRENGYNYKELLDIAYGLKNYDSTRYLIDSMSELELYAFITSDEYVCYGLWKILIIDKIYSTHDEYLISLLNSHKIDRDNDIIIRCYKIIKHLTVMEGKTLMTNINTSYESRLRKIHGDDTKSNDLRTQIKTEQSLHNELLIYHFTPRGSHTKGARTTF
jgi:hypothetical protein